eukprot:1159881-Pelagomonas_calceolata.AAC.3
MRVLPILWGPITARACPVTALASVIAGLDEGDATSLWDGTSEECILDSLQRRVRTLRLLGSLGQNYSPGANYSVGANPPWHPRHSKPPCPKQSIQQAAGLHAHEVASSGMMKHWSLWLIMVSGQGALHVLHEFPGLVFLAHMRRAPETCGPNHLSCVHPATNRCPKHAPLHTVCCPSACMCQDMHSLPCASGLQIAVLDMHISWSPRGANKVHNLGRPSDQPMSAGSQWSRMTHLAAAQAVAVCIFRGLCQRALPRCEHVNDV